MKKEILYLLSWVFAQNKKIEVITNSRNFLINSSEDDEELLKMGLVPVFAENKNISERYKGIKVRDSAEAWLLDCGRVVLLNNHSLVYIECQKYGKNEYVDGYQPKDMHFFDDRKVVAFLDNYDGVIFFAPLFKHWWQLYYYKFLLDTHAIQMGICKYDKDLQYSLARFLYHALRK